MRVVLITTVPISLRFLRGHVRVLCEKGASVHVISSPSPELDRFAAEHGVAAHGVEMTRSISPLRDLMALLRLVILFRSIRPQLVHAHTPKAGLLGMLAAWIARVPCRWYHIHGLPATTARRVKRRILYASDAMACRLAHQVFCVSHSIKQVVAEEGICCESKLAVLANGTIDGIDARSQFNPDRFTEEDRSALRRSLNIPECAAIVGFVGRIVEDKGIRELLAAFAQLEREDPAPHLLIVGCFEKHQRFAPELESALLENPRIHVLGFVDDPAPYYAIMNVLAFPSYREGFGLVAAEANAMEVPVVATRIPGCVDAVCDGVTGVLVPPRDAPALAAAVAEYIHDPERARAHGVAGRHRVLQNFQPEQVRQDLAARYVTVLAARPPGVYVNHGKRLLDLLAASVLLVGLSPVMMVVALLVRWRFGSPVIFWQQRPGLNGRLFWMPKFRTMTDGRDSTGELSPDAERLTPFGRFLRSTSLDELPELWSVVRGHMSLVGPRPLFTEYLDLYTPRQARRHEVRPGITGWAQVHGRNELAWEERFERDVWYVDHCSFWLDLKILWRTCGQVLLRRGITANGHATAERFTGTRPALKLSPLVAPSTREKSVIVLGAGGHAKVVIATLRAAGWQVEAVYDDDTTKHGHKILGVEIRGAIADLAERASVQAVIAIGDGRRRRSIASQYDFEWMTVVHPSAWVDPSVKLGPGTVICAGAVVQPDCRIGRHAIVNTLAGVDHDCRVGEFAHIGPGAHLAGGVCVGAGTLIGTGASAIPGVRIGAGVVVGAGGVVVHDLPVEVVAVGCPAKVIRDASPPLVVPEMQSTYRVA